MTESHVKPGHLAGLFNGCPICAAKQRGPLSKGTRFRIISGFGSNRTGIVVEDAPQYPVRPYSILAQMDDEPMTHLQNIPYERDLVEPLPSPPKPDWAPRISLADYADFHEAIINFCHAGSVSRRWRTDPDSLSCITCQIWVKRIPIPSQELWGVLAAHGVPASAKRNIERLYTFGLECLTLACGKLPIKKKRTK